MKREPDALFNDIAQFIDRSSALLKEGALMELAGLDDQIRTLCEEVLSLSEEQRVQYADRLQTLLVGLQALGNDMVQMRDKMAQDIRGLSSHQKANVAYRTAETSDRSGAKKPQDK